MPRNTSGVYTLPSGNPVVPGTTIDAAWANDTMEDLANEITNSLSRTGAGGMLSPFRIADGTVTVPGLAFLNETNTGLYRSGSGSAWVSVLGVNVAQFTSSGVSIPSTKALAALGNLSAGGTLSVTGATALSSTLVVTGPITATGGITGAVSSSSASITGGSINNTPIGGTTASTGAFTTLSATGGITANVTGNVIGDVTGNVTGDLSGNVSTGTGTSTFNNVQVNGTLSMSSGVINGLATPTADNQAANKAYVDTVAQGLNAKASCIVASTGNLTLSGAQTIDSVSVVAGDRVLVKDQTTGSQNGIYVVAAGAWTRSTDADTWNELVNAYTFVQSGTTNANNGFLCTNVAGGTLGTTPVTWVQFSGAGQIDAGAGMTKTGNTLNVGTASSSRIVVGADAIDLATTGVTGSTYKSVTVDIYGRVTAGTNPTTISGFGITDAYTITQIDALFGSTSSAAASASAASTSATNAANSASAASTSASNASSSATSASGSATSALSYLNSFRGQYLGPLASDPTIDGNGSAVTVGDLYWNTVGNVMKVYTGTAWITFNSVNNPVDQTDIGTAPNEIPLNQYLGPLAYLQQPYRKVQRQLATASQTAFTITGGYALGYIDVYQNGVKLYSTDYTETDTNTVTLAVGATLNDEMEFIVWWVGA